MPLKEAILPLVADHRGLVEELAAANTLVREGDGLFLWNSDPAGMTGALAAQGIASAHRAVLLGAGATARSAVRALRDIGVSELVVVSRDEHRARATREYASSRGVSERWVSLEKLGGVTGAELVVSTLPHGVDVSREVSAGLRRDAALLDVTYHPWPSPLATAWSGSARPVIPGSEMLLYQAVIQIRLFTSGDPDRPLVDEDRVIQLMRQALPHR